MKPLYRIETVLVNLKSLIFLFSCTYLGWKKFDRIFIGFVIGVLLFTIYEELLVFRPKKRWMKWIPCILSGLADGCLLGFLLAVGAESFFYSGGGAHVEDIMRTPIGIAGLVAGPLIGLAGAVEYAKSEFVRPWFC
jgi:hypothetical protein